MNSVLRRGNGRAPAVRRMRPQQRLHAFTCAAVHVRGTGRSHFGIRARGNPHSELGRAVHTAVRGDAVKRGHSSSHNGARSPIYDSSDRLGRSYRGRYVRHGV